MCVQALEVIYYCQQQGHQLKICLYAKHLEHKEIGRDSYDEYNRLSRAGDRLSINHSICK